jgi:hypothetical protein
MDTSDWLDAIRYQIFDTRLDTEFNLALHVGWDEEEDQSEEGRAKREAGAYTRPHSSPT